MEKRRTRKYLSLYLPMWPINLIERKRTKNKNSKSLDSGIALVAQASNQWIIVECSKSASDAGVKKGMPLTLAAAMVPGLAAYPCRPYSSIHALYKLALRALKISPLVAIDNDIFLSWKNKTLRDTSSPSYGLMLDITGTEKLHGTEEALSLRILKRLSSVGVEARIAVAPTVGAAWALSRYSESDIAVAVSNVKEALEKLPIQALRISSDTADSLHHAGIFSIEELLKLPHKELGLRFGLELINRIDQAFGVSDEPLRLVHPPFFFEVKKRFEVPLLRHESIKATILALFKKVLLKLEEQKRKAASFYITLQSGGAKNEKLTFTKEFALHSASKNISHLEGIITPFLESLVIPQGIEIVSISAFQTLRAEDSQHDFLSESELCVSKEEADELLNHFISRLGTQSVRKVAFHESHIPENSFSYSFYADASKGKSNAASQGLLSLPANRPSYIFPVPEPAKAVSMLPDKPPSLLMWQGKNYRIIRGVGPERISGEWWKRKRFGDAETRDYFKVQDHTGRWLWVFKNLGSLEWFVHGVWS